MKPIVVGVDGSEGAAHALRWGLREAQHRDCPLKALMIWDYLSQHHPDGSKTFDSNYDADAAAAALENFVIDAVGASASAEIDCEVKLDLPERGMVVASSSASMIVVGARGLGGFKGLLLGSVSQRVLRRSACAVVIVREPATEVEHGRVVVGVDGSDHGRSALRWAAREAELRDATLRVVHASDPTAFEYALTANVVANQAELASVGRSALDTALADPSLGALTEALRVDPLLAFGPPAAALLSASEDADLIVVGRSGRTALGRWILGSVAEQISHHSICPVAFVSADDM